ncbi:MULTISPECIES: inositol-3-phosphate synthase [unclassified Brevundimonas]|uniref:inositol-3-phosphate synthase n=1 Tax=unclassified Brevundimonas TaxID=2622653 RepID=UPI0006D121D3|nr:MULTISPECIES: inositol-3-phosphate synthase [unclassified Brevundimonas]ALJ08118.1 inositol-3-phosphate synthase [Brevundimonas sp. DS20]QFU31372.1 Inositol-3-phosphate synthase [Brevundimonas sp. Bb-A]
MQRKSVRIGVVGVGNCASSFVQGLAHYAAAPSNAPPPGLMNVELGGYRIEDMEMVSAFDIHAAKVGRDLSDAVFAPPNNTFRFASPGPSGVTVQRGPTLDGIGRYMIDDLEESAAPPVDVAQALRDSGTQVLVSYLPVGSQKATEYYAEQALRAGCAFVNCIPVFIASDPGWAKRFSDAGLPLVGDDIKSQVGATIVHRVLANLMRERGVRVDRTYQLNFGGNSDFKNMLERERLTSKKISKTQAVTSQFETPLADDDVHVGPSDFVPWLTDRKWAHIRLEGTTFGDVPISMEVKLEVWDSPNSAGVVIDAVRCAKVAMDRGVSGPLIGPSSWFMKSPPEQFTDEEARERTLRFIRGEEPAPAPRAARLVS